MQKSIPSSSWPIVATFNFPHEIILLRSRLELAEIPHFFKDEMVAQTSYALAVGGIKLQVPENHTEEVYALMQEVGLADSLPEVNPKPDIFEALSEQTAYLPLLKHVPSEIRWLVLLAACTIPTALFVYVLLAFFVF